MPEITCEQLRADKFGLQYFQRVLVNLENSQDSWVREFLNIQQENDILK